jgi:DNA polymerase-4
MPLRALYVDFNSYFASVEQQLVPELRGRPVAVLPVLAETTCCIAASYEAKRLRREDRHLGRRGAQAVSGNPIRSRPGPAFMSKCTTAWWRRWSPACMSSGCCRSTKWPAVSAAATSDTTDAVSLAAPDQAQPSPHGWAASCAVRSASPPTPFLAKVASDMQKPDGCDRHRGRGSAGACLYGLALRDLCGIGRAMEQRLHRHGIRTVQELCATSKERCAHAWGSIEGERVFARLRGEELPDPAFAAQQRQPFPRAAARVANAARRPIRCCIDCCRKPPCGCAATAASPVRLQVKVKFRDHENWERQARFDSTSDTLVLLDALDRLWQDFAGQRLRCGRRQWPSCFRG